MSRLPAKTRNPKPNVVVTTTIQAAVLEFASGFVKSVGFHHTGIKGTERENPVQEFFREHIPGKFSVCTGEAVDLYEKNSPQMDVIIFNSQNNYAFVSGDSLLLPAEALLVSIEVKSELNKEEIEKSLNAASKLRELRPFKKQLAPIPSGGGKTVKKRCRYFHCLFAYESDLSPDNWLRREYQRFALVSKSLKIPAKTNIDRLYVINRGLINFGSGIGFVEGGNSGEALMRFYMDILNFLIREDARRKSVPYIDYAGKMTKDWVKLE